MLNITIFHQEGSYLKKYLIPLTLVFLLCFASCKLEGDAPLVASKEGLFPYELSKQQSELLLAVNADPCQILIFCSPKELSTLIVKVYTLKDDHTWELSGQIPYQSPTKKDGSSQLAGSFSMVYEEDGTLAAFIQSSDGRFGLPPFSPSRTLGGMSSTWCSLLEPSKIKAEEEIPVSLRVWNQEYTLPCSLEDFYSPENLKDNNYVQAITLTFCTKAMENTPQTQGE